MSLTNLIKKGVKTGILAASLAMPFMSSYVLADELSPKDKYEKILGKSDKKARTSRNKKTYLKFGKSLLTEIKDNPDLEEFIEDRALKFLMASKTSDGYAHANAIHKDDMDDFPQDKIKYLEQSAEVMVAASNLRLPNGAVKKDLLKKAASIYFNIANEYEKVGDYSNAIASFQKSLNEIRKEHRGNFLERYALKRIQSNQELKGQYSLENMTDDKQKGWELLKRGQIKEASKLFKGTGAELYTGVLLSLNQSSTGICQENINYFEELALKKELKDSDHVFLKYLLDSFKGEPDINELAKKILADKSAKKLNYDDLKLLRKDSQFIIGNKPSLFKEYSSEQVQIVLDDLVTTAKADKRYMVKETLFNGFYKSLLSKMMAENLSGFSKVRPDSVFGSDGLMYQTQNMTSDYLEGFLDKSKVFNLNSCFKFNFNKGTVLKKNGIWVVKDEWNGMLGLIMGKFDGKVYDSIENVPKGLDMALVKNPNKKEGDYCMAFLDGGKGAIKLLNDDENLYNFKTFHEMSGSFLPYKNDKPYLSLFGRFGPQTIYQRNSVGLSHKLNNGYTGNVVLSDGVLNTPAMLRTKKLTLDENQLSTVRTIISKDDYVLKVMIGDEVIYKSPSLKNNYDKKYDSEFVIGNQLIPSVNGAMLLPHDVKGYDKDSSFVGLIDDVYFVSGGN
ncbi:hypothetical protein KY321_01290 [Candidatus Woesearchaeota archaeon]|nr:hypothetical protein [Candidatus Woesearchaeota archaeon]